MVSIAGKSMEYDGRDLSRRKRRDEDVNKLNKNKQFSHYAWAPLTDPAMSSFPQKLHLPYCSSKRMPGIEAGA